MLVFYKMGKMTRKSARISAVKPYHSNKSKFDLLHLWHIYEWRNYRYIIQTYYEHGIHGDY